MKQSLIVFLFFIFSAHIAEAQTLEDVIETIYNDYQLMGVSMWVAAENTSETIHFGKRDFSRDLDINDDTKFRIASISKAVTALGLLKLYDQGIIDLDDDISNAMGYTIRNPFYPEQPITYRMLLSHQSTLIDGATYTDFLDATFNAETIPDISELLLPSGNFYSTTMWLNTSPGTYFSYSNINYGLIGTLIEKLSGMRFDAYMKDEILTPMGLTASYNIQDLPNINDLAVLYRYNSGWQPQVDNYQGNLPTPPDLSNYQIGTNGLLFSPQGGLRASAQELGIFLDVVSRVNTTTLFDISDSVLNEMSNTQWTYNGSNGNNYFGLFNAWGLGLHVANGTNNDAICNLGDYGNFIGHPGEAYGLISDAFYENENNIRFALLINGSLNGYNVGNSAFYTIEEAIFEALCTYYENALDAKIFKDEQQLIIFPNPTKDRLYIDLKQFETEVTTEVLTLNGKVSKTETHNNTSSIVIETQNLLAGIYFINITSGTKAHTFKFIKR